MARKVEQVRYYTNRIEQDLNNITDLQELVSGRAFKYPIIQLGIEANEGTEFYLNNSLTTVAIGSSQIFQLDNTNIMSLRFLKASIASIQANGGHILIDYIYEE